MSTENLFRGKNNFARSIYDQTSSEIKDGETSKGPWVLNGLHQQRGEVIWED